MATRISFRFVSYDSTLGLPIIGAGASMGPLSDTDVVDALPKVLPKTFPNPCRMADAGAP